ncbi:hypothetical protein CALCODRAFT_488497 [Calocera cornea HHB12733]|uniref:Uncharacterized protein n=1 Tax=Calocera cornea HHB12733 TaxID=1353952 RepID=A0A165CFK8_9BASI|nr:hypothetical protein CALCODRAFT_488497 [Calocera cornea HHB12733]
MLENFIQHLMAYAKTRYLSDALSLTGKLLRAIGIIEVGKELPSAILGYYGLLLEHTRSVLLGSSELLKITLFLVGLLISLLALRMFIRIVLTLIIYVVFVLGVISMVVVLVGTLLGHKKLFAEGTRSAYI